jgi:hypothetical protein
MNINNNNQWKYTYSSFTMLWQLGDQSPTAKNFTQFLRKNKAPDCLTKDAPYKDLAVSLTRLERECPTIEAFLKSRYKTEVIKFFARNPLEAFKNLSLGTAVALTSTATNYGTVTTLVPSELNELIFGGVSPDFRLNSINSQASAVKDRNTNEPLWIFMPGLLIILIYFPINVWRQWKLPIRQSAILIYFLLWFEISLTILILPSEWFRQNAQYLIALYVLSAFIIPSTPAANSQNKKIST